MKRWMLGAFAAALCGTASLSAAEQRAVPQPAVEIGGMSRPGTIGSKANDQRTLAKRYGLQASVRDCSNADINGEIAECSRVRNCMALDHPLSTSCYIQCAADVTRDCTS